MDSTSIISLYIQKKYKTAPKFSVENLSRDNSTQFLVSLDIDGKVYSGCGSSVKSAKLLASEEAMLSIFGKIVNSPDEVISTTDDRTLALERRNVALADRVKLLEMTISGLRQELVTANLQLKTIRQVMESSVDYFSELDPGTYNLSHLMDVLHLNKSEALKVIHQDPRFLRMNPFEANPTYHFDKHSDGNAYATNQVLRMIDNFKLNQLNGVNGEATNTDDVCWPFFSDSVKIAMHMWLLENSDRVYPDRYPDEIVLGSVWAMTRPAYGLGKGIKFVGSRVYHNQVRYRCAAHNNFMIYSFSLLDDKVRLCIALPRQTQFMLSDFKIETYEAHIMDFIEPVPSISNIFALIDGGK